jgi:hypothetical protein
LKREEKANRRRQSLVSIQTQTTDHDARVSLPEAFANSTVSVEQISETEIRIRKVRVVPEDELRFYEGSAVPLSDRDRDVFLALLDDPPPPNAAFRKAAAKYRQRHG